MPNFTVDVDFEVICGTCGAGLCKQSRTDHNRFGNNVSLVVSVEACEKCLRQAEDRGFQKGYDEASKDVKS